MSERKQITQVLNSDLLLGGIDEAIAALQKVKKRHPDAIKIELVESDCTDPGGDCDYGCDCASTEVHITCLETDDEFADRLGTEEQERLDRQRASREAVREKEEKKRSELHQLEQKYKKDQDRIQKGY